MRTKQIMILKKHNKRREEKRREEKREEKMKKIAFVWYGESTFIEQDAKLLEKHFDVMPVRFDSIKSIFKIVKAVKDSDMSFSWFADMWSFITVATAKVFKKKSVVVVDGYDVECLIKKSLNTYRYIGEKKWKQIELKRVVI